MRIKKPVISYKNQPPKIPAHITITMLLFLKVYEVNDLIKGMAYAFIGILWIAWIRMIVMNDYEDVDIFKNKN